MKRFEIHYSKFDDRIKEINSFIDSVSEQKNFWNLVKTDYDRLAGEKYCTSISQLLNSTVQYNAVVISVYACFENYIDDLLTEYIHAVLPLENSLDIISTQARDKYIRTIAEYLTNPNRFAGIEITQDDAIKSAYDVCFNDVTKLVDLFLLRHGGNLKSEQLSVLMKDLGFENIIAAVGRHPFLNEIICEISNEEISSNLKINGENIFQYLNKLVDIRNIIAHSWISENRLSYIDLVDYIRVITSMAKIICDLVIENFIAKLYNKGKLYAFDAPISIFNNKILCINSKNAILKKGDFIYYTKSSSDYGIAKILNLQINHKDVDECLNAATDIGILLDRKIKDSFCFYYVTAVVN